MISGNKITLSVCGRFHHFNYANDMVDNGVIDDYFYSDKFNRQKNGVNLWVKEYLVKGHIRLFGQMYSDIFFPLYHKFWQYQLMGRLINTDLWHFMLHGNNPELCVKMGSTKCILFGEAVNTHPIFQYDVINAERGLRGLRPIAMSRQYIRLIDEIAQCNFFLVPSGAVKKSYINNGISGDRIYKIPFGVDVSRFSGGGQKDREKKISGKIKVGCVAQICLRKGQLYLLEAIEKIGFEYFDVVLVGRYSDDSAHLFERYKDKFTHINSIEGKDMPNFYNSIDLFVLPTLEEGLALVLCEAIASKVPIITTEASGVDDILIKNSKVKVIRDLSVDSLCEALIDFVVNFEDASESIVIQDVAVNGEMSWGSYSDNLIDVYKSILSDK
jgi:glycosyltransferase involved in cell wall biosynthesis